MITLCVNSQICWNLA